MFNVTKHAHELKKYLNYSHEGLVPHIEEEKLTMADFSAREKALSNAIKNEFIHEVSHEHVEETIPELKITSNSFVSRIILHQKTRK